VRKLIEVKREEEYVRCPGCGRKLKPEDIRTIRHFSEGYTVEVCSLCGRELVIYPLEFRDNREDYLSGKFNKLGLPYSM
jgi:DNA-directed RNA polymerase subunit RPC12/RpoP